MVKDSDQTAFNLRIIRENLEPLAASRIVNLVGLSKRHKQRMGHIQAA
jgi:hypothetical protein